MDKKDIVKLLSALSDSFIENKGWIKGERHVQTCYTVKLLEGLGWLNNIQIEETDNKRTPDIKLLNNVGLPLFIIESKDPEKPDSLDGKYPNKTFIEQIRDYCNATGVYWGILTNFVEWRIYSSYQKDVLYNNKKYAFHKLLWKDIKEPKDYVDILSEEGIQFIDKLCRDNLVAARGKWDNNPIWYPKQEEIKDAFFQNLKQSRFILRNFISNKWEYDTETTNLITQQILDRLIFVDYCSDNNITTQDKLHSVLYLKDDLHKELKKIFLEMDEKFNSELFASNEYDKLTIPDDVLRPIIEKLASTDFTTMSVHVMGEVYEDYLGELLRTRKHNIRVDESKYLQKRKSTAIYYSPEYIVAYMVKNTLADVLAKCKTINEIEKVRVIDISCGSASFLIRAFDEFLKHYERIQPSGLFQFETRKKILQKNLFGVDIDGRAVEIAKLNLLVKALENSSGLNIAGKCLLPNLKLNIRCGNSLISGEGIQEDEGFLKGNNTKEYNELLILHKKYHSETSTASKAMLFDKIMVLEAYLNKRLNEPLSSFFKENELVEANPFNYSVAFPEAFENGGFDVIVGNPPYLNVQLVSKKQKEYFSKRFKTFYKRCDMFGLFFEVALTNFVNNNGFVSLIVPQQIFNNLSYKKLRNLMLDNKWLQEVCYLGDKVFSASGANNDVCILVLKKPNVSNIRLIDSIDFNNPTKSEVKSDHFTKYGNVISFSNSAGDENIFNKIFNEYNNKIENQFDAFQGIVTGKNGAFMFLKDDSSFQKIEKELVHTCLLGRDFGKWHIRSIDRKIIYVNKDTNITDFPHAYRWLSSFKSILQKRRECKNEVIPWYSLQWPRIKTQLDSRPKIIIQGTRNPRLKTRIVATMDEIGVYGTQGLNFIVRKENAASIYYLLGILNSSLINYIFATKFLNVAIKAEYLKELPIPQAENESMQTIEKLVKKVLKATNAIEIKAIEREIDNEVFNLYGVKTDRDIERIRHYSEK